MPIVSYTVGTGGDYADAAAMKTAGNAMTNIVADDLNVIFWVLNDLTISGSATQFHNNNTDATHRIYVRPAPDLGFADLNPGGSAFYPASGIQLTANATSTNPAINVGNGWNFEGFRILCSAAGTAAPVFFNNTSAAVWSGFRRNVLQGTVTAGHLFSTTNVGAAALRQMEVLDNRFINLATSSSAAAVRVQRGVCYERNTVSVAGAYQSAIFVGVSGISPLIRDNAFGGDVEANRTTGTADSVAVNASTNNWTAGTFANTGLTTSTLYDTANFHDGYAPSDLFTTPGSDLRPKAAGPLIGAASSFANNTPDMSGRNRGTSPDVGSSQLDAAPAFATGTITTVAPSGQSVVLAGTHVGAVSGTVSLVGTTTLGPIAITIAGGNWTSAGFTGIPAGTYTRRLRLLNDDDAETIIDGDSLTIDAYSGDPEAPEPAEPETPPVVSDVEGTPTGATTATITATTTRSGGTVWAVVTTSATPPSSADIKAGTGAVWDDSQVPGSPGMRSFSATGLTAEATYYAHVFHEHPDGDSAVESSASWAQPAVVLPPTITVQPTNVTAEDGENAVFTVSFTGTEPITVQARRDGVNVSGAVVGTGTASYTITGVGPDDNGTVITFYLSNSADDATSDPATLTVDAPVIAPTITDEPDDITLTEGAAASFSVAATTGGGTLTYQWYVRPAGDSGAGTSVEGETSATFTTDPLDVGDNGLQAKCDVTNESATVVSTRWATATVNAIVLPGFDFDTATGFVFGDLAGALTALSRQSGVSVVAYAYSIVDGSLVAQSPVLTTNSSGRLARWQDGGLDASTAYRLLFVRESDGEVCGARMTTT